MPPFKFDAQSVFLTYPQSDIDKDDIINHLRSIADVLWCRVARERHADGNPHMHVVARFTRRVQSRNQNIFNVAGRHPNIQPVRSISKALAYVAKDGQFWDIGDIPTGTRSASDILELAATASEREYWLAAAEARLPYQYAARFWQIASSQDTIDESYEADITRERFDVCLQEAPEGRSTVIIGPSGIGKTSWAKRVIPKPALWVRHIDVLRQFRAGFHKSILFDDMSFDHLPRTSQIHLVDCHDDAHIHCRYGHATIPAGITKIFTANVNPFTFDEAIERRINKIILE